jgi:hypothetical protein
MHGAQTSRTRRRTARRHRQRPEGARLSTGGYRTQARASPPRGRGELLWPKLSARTRFNNDLLARMDRQHQVIAVLRHTVSGHRAG